MLSYLILFFFLGFPLWQSYYNYKRYKHIKNEYDKLMSYVNGSQIVQSEQLKALETENTSLKEMISSLEKQIKQKETIIDELNNINSHKYKDNESSPKKEHNKIISYRFSSYKFSVRDIQDRKDTFLVWEDSDNRISLKLLKRFIGNVDYEPRCNYANKGWNGPEIVNKGEQCCTVTFGDAYLQIRVPKRGIIHLVSSDITLNENDIILYIDYNIDAINDFEKGIYKRKILDKKRKQDIEKVAYQELVNEGTLFPNAGKRPHIPKDVVDAVWARDGGKCVYCGSTENLQLDHIIPFSKGGASTVENLQLLCQKCNLKKSNKIG